MKCTNCGYESEQPFAYCTNCGAPVASATEVVVNPAANRAIAIIKDNLFLTICILISVGTLFSMDVISILFTIFFWLTYAQGRKGLVDTRHLRSISGTTYASYVLGNVASIILIVCGVILDLCYMATMYSGSALIDSPLIDYTPDIVDSIPFADALNYLSAAAFVLILGVIFTVMGVAMLLINIFAQRKIHRFAKSFYQGIEVGSLELHKPHAVKNWLIVFAVFSCLSALSSLGDGLSAVASSGCTAAAEIIAVVLINKYCLGVESN